MPVFEFKFVVREHNIMTEDFLQFAWRTLSFKLQVLKTRNQEIIRIITPGVHNRDQGPDFLDARIRIGKVEWNGQVEIHLHGDEWYRHGHHRDPLYNNVILHVVYEKGKDQARRLDGTPIPELVLGPLLDPDVKSRYENLQKQMDEIPCRHLLNTVPTGILYSWYEVLFRERLMRKADDFRRETTHKTTDLHEAYFLALAGHFGGILNGELFRTLFRDLPYSVIRKNADKPEVLEAILLGKAGLLRREDFEDPYEINLKQEWLYQQKKYNLASPPAISLRYMRMRPAGFPDLRLAQLAVFLHQYPDPGIFIHPESWKGLLKQKFIPSNYWKTRHRIGQAEKAHTHVRPGKDFLTLLLMNVVLPLAYFLKSAHGKPLISSEEWNFIRMLPPEKNRITRLFEQSGLKAGSATEAQAQIQLYKQYCLNKKCLNCAIGKYCIGGGDINRDYLMEG
jgi:hypothetical protein